MYNCEICSKSFERKSSYIRHLESDLHKKRENNSSKVYKCICGKSYSYSQTLYKHKQICPHVNESKLVEKLECERQDMKQQLERLEKEREEMKVQIALLMDKHATNNNTTNNINTKK